jgi:putative transposase
MQLGEMTAVFEPAQTASSHGGGWLRLSCLERGKRIALPLCATPYLRTETRLAKSVLLFPRRKHWYVQLVERTEPTLADGSAGKVAVDVGLNVLAATSDGRLYGAKAKPAFDRLYKKVRTLRQNRQRQGLEKDSPRLQRLEQKLSGFIATAVGTVVNLLVLTFANYTFVIEDLELQGCRGQKRFAYRQLQQRLASKAVVQCVAAAYSSQECLSCHYVSRRNRSGTKFRCRSCGRVSHADVVGARNLLGRSEDNQLACEEDHRRIGAVLRARFCARRRTSASGCCSRAPPLRPSLTVHGLPSVVTATNGAME